MHTAHAALLSHTHRRGITELDDQVMELMDSFDTPYCVVLTKADTVTPGVLSTTATMVASALHYRSSAFPYVYAISCRTGQGLKPLMLSCAAALSATT